MTRSPTRSTPSTEHRRRLAATSDELHHAELRFTELSGRRTAIRERLETEWKRPLEEMIAEVPPVDLDDEALRAEAAELRRQLEQLGPVNALAIEEHDETLKRHDFLVAQRADLFDARASLLQAIKEIDATARELFLATFEQVRVNFREIFMSLFGGGECDLRLENPDTPLDCDIEIHASPRGKKTQRIHLLSSGERALVALSLLFGIFLTKPSPFCLLDEVDAPLDDANVGRFVRMLNQFKSRTQFIVITHNPRTTTEAGDAVYGVTMQEPGVSSLVSVRMRGASTEADRAGRRRGGGSRRRDVRRGRAAHGRPRPLMRLVTLGTGTVALTAGARVRRPLRRSGRRASPARLRQRRDAPPRRARAALAADHARRDHALPHSTTSSDLATLVFAWKYGDLPGRSAPLTLIGPVGIAALLEKFIAAFGDWLREPGFPLHVQEIAPGDSLDLGDGTTLRATKVPHTDESVAYAIERGTSRRNKRQKLSNQVTTPCSFTPFTRKIVSGILDLRTWLRKVSWRLWLFSGICYRPPLYWSSPIDSPVCAALSPPGGAAHRG